MEEIWSYRPAVVTEPAVEGYRVEATDGSVGTVAEATYEAGRSCLVVEGKMATGRRRLIPAGIVVEIDHEDQLVRVDRTTAQIEAAPEFDEETDGGEAHIQPFGDDYWGAFGSTAE